MPYNNVVNEARLNENVISMDLLKNIVNNKSTTIIDVRSHSEFNNEHLPGAKNIPLGEIADHRYEFLTMQKPVVLYCRDGVYSAIALNILQHYGISELYNGGGINELKKLMNEYV